MGSINGSLPNSVARCFSREASVLTLAAKRSGTKSACMLSLEKDEPRKKSRLSDLLLWRGSRQIRFLNTTISGHPQSSW
ncbi:hypothetical protein KCU98_g104, partial [Aureobasidium melanogenum]